jgi:hypothetical protein
MYCIYDFKESMVDKSKIIVMTRYRHKIIQTVLDFAHPVNSEVVNP